MTRNPAIRIQSTRTDIALPRPQARRRPARSILALAALLCLGGVWAADSPGVSYTDPFDVSQGAVVTSSPAGVDNGPEAIFEFPERQVQDACADL